MSSLSNRTAIVTGASRGIGRAIAEAFAQAGAKLALVARDAAKLEEVSQACQSLGAAEVRTYALDVNDSAGIAATVKQVATDCGGIDILVNNAGITRDTLLMRMKEDDWDAVLTTNLKAAFLLTQAATRYLMKSSFGRIINVASVIGITGNAGQANYAASKGGLIAFTKSVAKELASRGVTCNAIAPGMIETDMTNDLSEEQRSAILTQIPLGRHGTPREVAQVALFLAGDSASYVTGQAIVVDGGMVM